MEWSPGSKKCRRASNFFPGRSQRKEHIDRHRHLSWLSPGQWQSKLHIAPMIADRKLIKRHITTTEMSHRPRQCAAHALRIVHQPGVNRHRTVGTRSIIAGPGATPIGRHSGLWEQAGLKCRINDRLPYLPWWSGSCTADHDTTAAKKKIPERNISSPKHTHISILPLNKRAIVMYNEAIAD